MQIGRHAVEREEERWVQSNMCSIAKYIWVCNISTEIKVGKIGIRGKGMVG